MSVNPRVQQVALVDLELPVQHVDTQEVAALGDQLVDMVEQFLHLVGGDESANDQEAVLSEAHVLLDADWPGVHRREATGRVVTRPLEPAWRPARR
jgi:hypothetical protein